MWEFIQHWVNNNWLTIVIVLVVAYVVHRFGQNFISPIIRRAVKHRAHGDLSDEDIRKRQNTIIALSAMVLRFMVWAVAMFTILGRFGIDLTPLLAGASVLGVAIGFGAQSLIKDFITGLFIVMENQYRVGDVVVLDNAEGKVEQITVRSTVLRDDNGSVHYIPNGNIAHSINKTTGFSKVNLAIAVKPTTDIDEVSKVIDDIGKKMTNEEKWAKKIIDAPHFASIGAFSNTSLEVKVLAKTQPSAQWAVTDELRKRLLAAFRKHNFELSTPPAPAAGNGKKK